MKDVITAIGDEKLNNKLKEYKNIIAVKNSDIQYQEGIFEILEKNENIDILIINENIIGNLTIEELIKKIIIIKNNIEIILIVNKLEEINKNKNIIKIIKYEENYIKEILEYFNIKINIEEEEKLKIKSEIKIEKNKLTIIEKIKSIIFKNKQKKEIITFIGPAGIGKTTILAIFAKLIKNKKILIIDFNLINNNLHTIFGIKKYSKEIEEIQNTEIINEFKLNENNLIKLIIKLNNKINLISETKIIFDDEYKINSEKIKILFNELKNNYDLILIDTTSEKKYEKITNEIIKLSDKIICLTEGNLIQIEKTKKILDKYIEGKEKINIVLNKEDKYTINNKILLKETLNKIKIIGEINYDKDYNKIINRNVNTSEINKNIKNDIYKIIDKIGCT